MSTEKTRAITPKELLFVQEYLGGQTIVDSYINAGYTNGTAKGKPHAGATRLLKRPAVQAKIKELTSDSVIASTFTREKLAVRLWDIHEQALKEQKLDSGIRALIEIGKLAGYYTDRIDVSIDTSKDERLSEISTADIAKFIIEHRADDANDRYAQ